MAVESKAADVLVRAVSDLIVSHAKVLVLGLLLQADANPPSEGDPFNSAVQQTERFGEELKRAVNRDIEGIYISSIGVGLIAEWRQSSFYPCSQPPFLLQASFILFQ